MQWFMEAAQPYLQTIVLALMGLIASMVVAALMELRQKVLGWIKSRTSTEQRKLLHRLAEEAFSLVEKLYKSEHSQTKLAEARQYLYDRIKEYGLNVSDDEILAVIEKAVLDYNTKVKSTQVPR
jgi:hypothetical protein